jgi:hypothetical protein
MMETGAQGFPPKNGPPVFQAAEDKAPGLQPASVQQHGASAPKTLTAGAAGATGAASIQLMQYDPGHRHGDGKPVLDADAAEQAVAPTGRQNDNQGGPPLRDDDARPLIRQLQRHGPPAGPVTTLAPASPALLPSLGAPEAAGESQAPPTTTSGTVPPMAPPLHHGDARRLIRQLQVQASTAGPVMPLAPVSSALLPQMGASGPAAKSQAPPTTTADTRPLVAPPAPHHGAAPPTQPPQGQAGGGGPVMAPAPFSSALLPGMDTTKPDSESQAPTATTAEAAAPATPTVDPGTGFMATVSRFASPVTQKLTNFFSNSLLRNISR